MSINTHKQTSSKQPGVIPGTDREKVIGALHKIREAFDEGLLTDLLAEKVDY